MKANLHNIAKAVALFAMLTVIVVVLVGCESEQVAAVVRLEKTDGSYTIYDEDNKVIDITEDMKLYSGYSVITSEDSVVYLDLDETKIVKIDENSECEIVTDGKNLKVELTHGNMFFNVTAPLEDDESMNIVTSTTITSIRGTSGYIETDGDNAVINLLTGKVTVSAEDLSTDLSSNYTLNAGEKAVVTASETQATTVEVAEVDLTEYSEFVLSTIEDEELDDEIEDTLQVDFSTYYADDDDTDDDIDENDDDSDDNDDDSDDDVSEKDDIEDNDDDDNEEDIDTDDDNDTDRDLDDTDDFDDDSSEVYQENDVDNDIDDTYEESSNNSSDVVSDNYESSVFVDDSADDDNNDDIDDDASELSSDDDDDDD